MKRKFLVLHITLIIFSKFLFAQEKETVEFSKYEHYSPEKELQEFKKYEHFTPEKELKEFEKFSHETPEKELKEFEKFSHETPEKELAEFKVYTKEETSPKLKKEFAILKSKKIKKQLVPNLENTQTDSTFYSVFTDFRIPVREEINESYLDFAGWKTDANTYTYRCQNKKRVRLTFWYTDLSGDQKVEGSEFINVTHTHDDCLENDLIYEHQAPAPPQIIRTKVKVDKPEKPKDEEIKKSKPKKKKFKAWQGLEK